MKPQQFHAFSNNRNRTLPTAIPKSERLDTLPVPVTEQPPDFAPIVVEILDCTDSMTEITHPWLHPGIPPESIDSEPVSR